MKKFCVFGSDFEAGFPECVHEVNGKKQVLCHDFETLSEAQEFLVQIKKSAYRAKYQIYTKDSGQWHLVS